MKRKNANQLALKNMLGENIKNTKNSSKRKERKRLQLRRLRESYLEEIRRIRKNCKNFLAKSRWRSKSAKTSPKLRIKRLVSFRLTTPSWSNSLGKDSHKSNNATTI